nr:hypothetical protein [uncultured Rhodopila sp.]
MKRLPLACFVVSAVIVIGSPRARAQPSDGSVLPFPPAPTASIAGPTLQESQHVRSPVSFDYFDRAPFRFGGNIEKVEVQLQ